MNATPPAGGTQGSDVLYHVVGSVATITLHRPDRLNAISSGMLDELATWLSVADADERVRAIVLTGAGRAFCAGLDLQDANEGPPVGLSEARLLGMNTRSLPTSVLFEIDTPVIAAINGPAVGYGLDLALGCDLRLLATSGRLIAGFARIGLVPESGGTWYLPRLIGWARAAEICLLSEEVSSTRALELGLVNAVVADGQLASEARAWAERIAANAPLATRAIKRLFRHGLTEDFPSHTHHVLMHTLGLMRSRDFTEGVTSWRERREPDFIGR